MLSFRCPTFVTVVTSVRELTADSIIFYFEYHISPSICFGILHILFSGAKGRPLRAWHVFPINIEYHKLRKVTTVSIRFLTVVLSLCDRHTFRVSSAWNLRHCYSLFTLLPISHCNAGSLLLCGEIATCKGTVFIVALLLSGEFNPPCDLELFHNVVGTDHEFHRYFCTSYRNKLIQIFWMSITIIFVGMKVVNDTGINIWTYHLRYRIFLRLYCYHLHIFTIYVSSSFDCHYQIH